MHAGATTAKAARTIRRPLGDGDAGAVLSRCGRYRYSLHRTWNAALPVITFVLLNPSTADAWRLDPTATRCVRRAQAMGLGGVRLVNLFALRCTDPDALHRDKDPVGPDNDAATLAACRGAVMVVCGWGREGCWAGRDQVVLALLAAADVPLHYLGLNANGTPKHPLYVGYDIKPAPWLAETR